MRVIERFPSPSRKRGATWRMVANVMRRLLATTLEKISRSSVLGSDCASSSRSPPPAMEMTCSRRPRLRSRDIALPRAPSSWRSIDNSPATSLASECGNRLRSAVATTSPREDKVRTVARPIEPAAPVMKPTRLSEARIYPPWPTSLRQTTPRRQGSHKGDPGFWCPAGPLITLAGPSERLAIRYTR
jgi:hypothetical protein